MIYCVEDDASIRDIEVYTLCASGFEAVGAEDANALFRELAMNIPELILLDIMLPGDDGVKILQRLKANSATADIPVIMATAKGAEYDKVISLDIGADDYLVKPFGMMEMVSRVRAVLRRAGKAKDSRTIRIGELELDPQKHIAMAVGTEVPLTFKEFELLKLLMTHKGMVYTRDMLLTQIWGVDYDGETRTVDVHIRSLRQKLGACGEYVETVRGLGYRMKEKL